MSIYIGPGSLVRYVPKLQSFGEDDTVRKNVLEFTIAAHHKNDAKKGLVER